MYSLEQERKKLIEIKNQYLELIKEYDERIKKVMTDYKKDPFLQAALLEQLHTKLNQLKKSIDNPFFGRIDFLHEGSSKNEICYIGKVGVLDSLGDPITVDWRAPISALYYDSNVGPAEYLAPSGIIKGDLKLKRQYEIENGHMKGFQDVNTVSNDELLKPYLSSSADNRLKNIVSTIQSEQNAIIRKKLKENNIIQGTAGSGKTTVALHRIAYLVYNMQKEYNQNQFIVIGPNAYFMDYISSVLPDLDVHTVTQYTFLNIVNEYINEKIKIIDQNNRLENYLSNKKLDANIQYKVSLTYKKALDKFIVDIKSNIIHGPIKCENTILFSERDISRYLNNSSLDIIGQIKQFTKFAKKYIKDNFDDIKHRYWSIYRDEYLSLPLDSPRRKEILKITETFNSEVKNIDKILKSYFNVAALKPLKLYKLFVDNIECYVDGKDCDAIKLKNDTLKSINSKTLGYEDLPALIYLNLNFNGYKDYDKYVHVVLDEAQDFGLFHFEVLKKLFKNGTFSIFGDLAQSIYSYQSIDNWEEVVNNIFNDHCNVIKLEKSYRTTYEIMSVANLISSSFGFGNAEAVLRHGNEVEAYQLDSSNVGGYISARINEFINFGYKSIAIICKTDKDVSGLSKVLTGENISHNVVNSQNTKYDGGICLIPSYLSKGLEFDAAIIYDIEKYNPENEVDMKLLYVSITRALHQLDITYDNELIEPLKTINKNKKYLKLKN